MSGTLSKKEPAVVRVTVSYHEQDEYKVPEEKWRDAMKRCGDDKDDAFDFLMDCNEDFFWEADVTDRYVEVEKW